MNRDEIIRMAREASNTPIDHHATPDLFGVSQIERFAALVAAAEREACAELCERMARRINSLDIRTAALEMAAENIRARGQA